MAQDVAPLQELLALWPRDAVEQKSDIAHDLRGQAGTFDYQLAWALADCLCRFLDAHGASPDRKVLRVLVDALQRIAGDRLTGDGGKVGQALMAGLAQIVPQSCDGGRFEP